MPSGGRKDGVSYPGGTGRGEMRDHAIAELEGQRAERLEVLFPVVSGSDGKGSLWVAAAAPFEWHMQR